MFTFGIEHEVAFIDRAGRFADFRSLAFADLAAIIDALPLYEEDYPQLRVGRSGVRRKRWYIEGYERRDEQGAIIGYLPKGIEIRTTPRASIGEAIGELGESFQRLREVATAAGLTPVLTSFHPYYSEVVPPIPFSAFEEGLLQRSASERAALLALLTFGPDFNLSCRGVSASEVLDIGMKYTFYSPYIIPFSYSSPFWRGALWDGLSVRTFKRTGRRAVAYVFLAPDSEQRTRYPTLVKQARLPSEVGRIEFKACDSCDGFELYAGLLALLKGLALDTTLAGRALEPDVTLHQRSARYGFDDETIVAGSRLILRAARLALGTDPDVQWLHPLYALLRARATPARHLIDAFTASGSIEAALRQTYSMSLPLSL